MNQWSKWYKFSDIFEYYGPINEDRQINKTKKIFSYDGKRGHLHEDDGFRLRSKEKFSYRNIPLKVSLKDKPCPIDDSVIWGCYWLKIESNNPKLDYNYIGQCTEKNDGLRKRLTSHFREICDLPSDPNGKQIVVADMNPAEKTVQPIKVAGGEVMIDIKWENNDIRGINKQRELFKDASQKIRDVWEGYISDPKESFFEKCVSLKFIEVDKEKKLAKKDVHRIEGMALAAYYNKFSYYPNLNSRDETKGLDGLFD